jgi:hypothetical protein
MQLSHPLPQALQLNTLFARRVNARLIGVSGGAAGASPSSVAGTGSKTARSRTGNRRTGKRGAHAANLVRRGPWHLDRWRLGADGRCPVGGFSIVTWSCGDRSGPRYHTHNGCPWGSDGTPCAIGAAIPGAESYLAHAFRSRWDDASGRYGLARSPSGARPQPASDSLEWRYRLGTADR